MYGALDEASRGLPQSELFAWATTMIFAGDAAGAILAGLVSDATATALPATLIAGCAATLAAGLYRRRLYPAGSTVGGDTASLHVG